MPSTTPHGIVYPASSDAPRVWEDMQDMANSVETAMTAMGTWTTYTPTFTAGITAVGTGAVREGWYCRVGNIVFWGGRIQFGTTPAANATIQMDIPPAIAAYSGGGDGLTNVLGTWQYRDNSVPAHFTGAVCVYANGGLLASFNGASDGTLPQTRINATQPFAPAVDDKLTWSGMFRAL
jgi:hypothetical protein